MSHNKGHSMSVMETDHQKERGEQGWMREVVLLEMLN